MGERMGVLGQSCHVSNVVVVVSGRVWGQSHTPLKTTRRLGRVDDLAPELDASGIVDKGSLGISKGSKKRGQQRRCADNKGAVHGEDRLPANQEQDEGSERK